MPSKKYQFVDTGRKTARFPIPPAPIFSVSVAFSASLSLTLALDTDDITNARLTARAEVDGAVNLDLGVNCSFSVGPVGISLAGAGIRGAVELSGRASLTFAAAGATVTASMAAVTLTLDMAAYIYFECPTIDLGVYEIDSDEIAESIASLSSSLSDDGSLVLYEVGRITIMQATTPSYRGSFDAARGQFSGIAQSGGNFTFGLSQEIKDAFVSLKRHIESAINGCIPSWVPIGPIHI